MDLAAMRAKFVTRSATSTSQWVDADIDTFLNASYQYAIAAQVPGSITDGEWTIATVSGTAAYTYPNTIYEVKGIARTDRGQIDTRFRKGEFDADYSAIASNAKPTAVLFYGRSAQFYPTPNDVYTITVPARLTPAVLDSDGLVNHNHAMAVVCDAVREYAEDKDIDEMVGTQALALDRYLGALKTQSLARPRERAEGLSF